jgi:hypothetical protein
LLLYGIQHDFYSTALCVATGEGLTIHYGSVVIYHLPHKKNANCTLALQVRTELARPLDSPMDREPTASTPVVSLMETAVAVS